MGVAARTSKGKCHPKQQGNPLGTKISMMWLTPEVREHLVYWRNPLETGVVFGSVLVMLVAVKYVSLISVVGNLLLALVTSTVAFRIYKSILTALGKSQDKSHPFQRYLDADVELPAERVLALMEEVVFHLNGLIKKLNLVENMIESLKFAAAMYLMTFVGRLVNIVTLLIIAWVTVFAWPRIYQDNQTKIDEALAPIKVKVEELTSKLTTATSKKVE